MHSSYRLESTTRSKPSQLHLDRSSYQSTSNLTGRQSPTLLYDAPPMGSPTSPTSIRGLGSPTSPTFSPRARKSRSHGRSPAPAGRNRSQTPSRSAQGDRDLEEFAEHCKAWYFSQDENSGRLMTQTLAGVSQSQRAPYSRLQASIRSAYHRSVSLRKTAEFRALLAATLPGASVLAHSRASPHSRGARAERYERFQRFVSTWCTQEMPGPQPFFQGLWAIMRLQVLPENLGGAGSCRIDWEIDDAVFKESAGKEFMQDAIDCIKGYLGFDTVATTTPSTPRSTEFVTTSKAHTKAVSQPVLVGNKSIAQSNRRRAPSDPFLDTPPPSRHLLALEGESSTGPSSFPPSPRLPQYADEPTLSALGREFMLDEEDEDAEFLRIWISPDLSNAEYLDLLGLFPTFVTRRTLPRFPTERRDVEEGYSPETNHIRCGTGKMWPSSRSRTDGWEGGWWSRFVQWFRRTFC